MDANANKCNNHRFLYSSVQYNLPQTVAQKITDWGKEKIPDEVLYNDPDMPSYGRESLIHCTVFFGLHTEFATPVLFLLHDERPFLLRLGAISCFSNDKFDVVKVEAFSEDLMRLHNKIGGCLTSTEAFNSYRPHITIAYVQKGSCQHLIGDETFNRLTVRVESLCFSSKKGGRCRIRLASEQREPVYV